MRFDPFVVLNSIVSDNVTFFALNVMTGAAAEKYIINHTFNLPPKHQVLFSVHQIQSVVWQ